jgi:type VI secretion system secreted protein VgrG
MHLLQARPLFASAGDLESQDEDFFWGLHATDPASLDASARIQLERLEGLTDTLDGTSNTIQVQAGKLLEIEGAGSPFGGTYYVVGATHHYFSDAGGGFYGNSFRCIPDSARFRPRCRREKTGLSGVEAAIVTGPAGLTTYADAYGRVKVRFPWDRAGTSDESSSAWVHVAQNRAAGPASYYLPEIGDEVLVAFLNGDPDRPVILGSLFNDNDRPPR